MEVMPGTQKTPLAQRETYALDNALSRGQEIMVEVDESKSVPLILSPGEMSLHHIGIAHSSKANRANYSRVGMAVRYLAPEVVQQGSVRQIVQLVRGNDEYGNFEIVAPPSDAAAAAEIRKEAELRMLKNVYPATPPN